MRKECKYCKKPFEARDCRQIYCSHECSESDKLEKQKRTCKKCGKIFITPKKRNFCPECTQEAKDKGLMLYMARCKRCGKAHVMESIKHNSTALCDECAQAGFKRGRPVKEKVELVYCKNCGRLFTPYERKIVHGMWRTAGRYTCSWECSSELYGFKS